MQTAKIPLHEFEQHIGETILGRGLSYFKKGHVREPVELSPGHYEAIVTGSDDYIVQLKIAKGNITGWECDCPYDGGICKHVAAVIFYLQQDVLDIKPAAAKSPGKTKKAPVKRKKTIQEQVKDLLEKISYEELKDFITYKSVNDPTFRAIFFSSFIHLEEEGSITFYRKFIKTALQPIIGRRGFIYRDDTRKIDKLAREFMDRARRHEEDGNLRNAIMTCCALMEEMIDVMGYADDSNGLIGDAIDAAYDMLYDLASSGLPGEERLMLLGYVLNAFEKGVYEGWDWHVGMLELAEPLSVTEKEIAKIIGLVDKTLKRSVFHEEQLLQLKLGLLLKLNQPDKAEQLRLANLDKPSFRRAALETAFANGEFKKAAQLASEGIEQDERAYGLVLEWKQWLLKIAQKQNDKKGVIAIARSLFISRYDAEPVYYELMKHNVGEKDWPAFIEELVKELLSSRSWPDRQLALAIYIKEEWWDRLMNHLAKFPNLREIAEYEQYLSRPYRKELIGLYMQTVPGAAKSANSRNNYRDVCRYLSNMIRLGAKKEVSELVAGFKASYKKKRSFMEELDALKL